MNMILVTDIFGNTPHVTGMAEELSAVYSGIEVIDPYEGVNPCFCSQQEAYDYFQGSCGLDRLAAMAQKAVLSDSGRVVVVGFSVGATAAWCLAGSEASRNMHRAVCFYGSRIREKLDVEPLCETMVVLPRREEACDVDALYDSLCGRHNIGCIRTGYLHGFMNQYSGNFHEEGFCTYMNWLKQFAQG